MKCCWLCSVNLPRIGKQVQFTINANIPRQTVGNCSRFTKLYAYFAITEIRAITSPCSISPLYCVWAFFEGCGNYSHGRSTEREYGTTHERNRHEIWLAAVLQNFRVICASSTQTAPIRAKLKGKLCGGWNEKEEYCRSGANKEKRVSRETTKALKKVGV